MECGPPLGPQRAHPGLEGPADRTLGWTSAPAWLEDTRADPFSAPCCVIPGLERALEFRSTESAYWDAGHAIGAEDRWATLPSARANYVAYFNSEDRWATLPSAGTNYVVYVHPADAKHPVGSGHLPPLS